MKRKRSAAIAPTNAPEIGAHPPQQHTGTHIGQGTRIVQVLAVLAAAVLLVPTGAHFFEMANKMALGRDTYMAVQDIYRGWSMFGFAVGAGLLLTAIHTVLVRHDRPAMVWSLLAFLAIVGTQIVFWTWTFPANALTQNWTVAPDNFEAVRRQWEYSHAASAALNLFALLAITIAVIASARGACALRAGNYR